jgi:cell division inhibitor SepF
MFRRAMVYLGLADDEYDEYEPYGETQQPVAQQGVAVPGGPGPAPMAVEQASPMAAQAGVRALPREPREAREDPGAAGVTVTPRPATPGIRPVATQSARVHVAAPVRFPDAQEIGDRFKGLQPVIVNLQGADRDLSRRMIDFCSGVTYALGGSMEKVADKVYLLTPSNVEVSAEERRRLQERGLFSA